jgi:hypothetical protein
MDTVGPPCRKCWHWSCQSRECECPDCNCLKANCICSVVEVFVKRGYVRDTALKYVKMTGANIIKQQWAAAQAKKESEAVVKTPSPIETVVMTTTHEEGDTESASESSESSEDEPRVAALKEELKTAREAHQKDKLRVIALEKDLETTRKTHEEYELRVATLETDLKMSMETHLKDEKKHEDDQLELNQSKKRVRELEDELGLLKESSDEEKKQCNECGKEKFISSFKVTTRKKGKDGNIKTYTSTRNVCNTCETRKRRKTSK